MSQLEGTTGVASISAGGMVESKINVSINEDKIEALNQKLLSQANASLASARAQAVSYTHLDVYKRQPQTHK